MAECSYPGCPRPARARGFCLSHYKQSLRERPLAELRPRGLTRLSVRLPPELVEQLERRGPTAPIAARDVLVEWGKRGKR